MAILLKDDVGKLAQELAEMEGISVGEAVAKALEERRAKLVSAREEKLRKMRQRLERIRALPIIDPRDPDDILYDEFGLPKND